MNELEEKTAFAQAMISAKMNPLEAGQLVHPCNFARAAQIASMWHNDAEVKEIISELKNAEIEESGISEDEKYVEEKLKEIIENSRGLYADETKIKALDKLMELKGLSKKPQNGASVQVVIPRAIEIPTHGTNEEWENAAAQQQRELLNVSRSRH
jgi:hypothetical protein